MRFHSLLLFSLLFHVVEIHSQTYQPPRGAFPYTPPQNFYLFMNKRLVNHPVSTAHPVAQQFFNQGLTLAYAFNQDAAYWSFLKASQIDPDLAMAYWGMALVLGQNINIDIDFEREQIATGLMQKALKLSQNVTKNEKAYIQALSKRYSADPKANRQELAQAYHQAMKKVSEQFPDDLDAATLYAESGLDLRPWRQWDEQGNPRPGTLEVVAILENVLKKNPDHLGANHYYIHAVEASKHPERALMSAYRLRYLLPNAGHILHMPAHVYFRVGDYHEAAIVNEIAIEADKNYIQKFGLDGIYPIHYLSHNLNFLSRSYSMEGRPEDAIRLANELYQFYRPAFQAVPELEYYATTPLFVRLRFKHWKEMVAAPLLPTEMQIASTLDHFARAIAYASLDELEEAKNEQKIFLKMAQKLSPEAKFGSNKAESIVAIAKLVLQAKIAEEEKQPAAAIAYLKQAIDLQDHLRYNEPPDWSIPVRESLGELLLKEKLYGDAEKVYREDLERYPRNGWALHRLFLSLKAQNREADAFWVRQAFDKAWQYSTISLDNQ